MADQKRNATVFFSGVVPGFEAFRDFAGIQTYSSLPGCRPLDDHELQLLESMKQTNSYVVEFKSKFPRWVDERRNVIESINLRS